MPGISDRLPDPSAVVKVDIGLRGGRSIEARPLIIGEKEQLVALDRTAHRPAEFIPALSRGRCSPTVGAKIARPFVGVEKIVAQKLERDRHEIGCAGLQADTDHSAQKLAELGARDYW